MQDSRLNLIRGDDKVFTVGYDYQTRPNTIKDARFLSEDGLSGFWMDS